LLLEQEEFPIPDGGGLLRTTTVVERKISPSFQAKHVHYHNWYKNVLNISACFG
jgi:hypothetical protein